MKFDLVYLLAQAQHCTDTQYISIYSLHLLNRLNPLSFALPLSSIQVVLLQSVVVCRIVLHRPCKCDYVLFSNFPVKNTKSVWINNSTRIHLKKARKTTQRAPKGNQSLCHISYCNLSSKKESRL